MRSTTFPRTRLLGQGAFLPGLPVSNEELVQRFALDTDDAWIRQRTGITRRYLAAEGEYTSDLAAVAANRAMDNAAITPDEVDIVIVATTSPDHTFPSTATITQAKIGANRAFAFDIQAVCSGFVYALVLADSLLASGQYRTALVIGAETMSRLLDWQDRTTCVLFGDGAGAVVLRREENSTSGILAHHLASDGQFRPLLHTTGGASVDRQVGVLRMEGRDVFRHAVQKMSDSVAHLLEHTGTPAGIIRAFIPHQANQRIIDAVGERLNIPAEKVVSRVAVHANTSAASIPLAFSDAMEQGMLKSGDTIVFTALGAGFTWGSVLLTL